MKNYLTQLAEKKKAMIAFNVQSLFQLNALYQISQSRNVPVIAQFSAKYIPYFDKLYGFDFLVKKFQGDRFFFHLDHCMDEKLIKFCIDKGFASVMFDGSSLPVRENADKTNQIYQYASSKGSLLEAELGAITGVEDGFGSDDPAGGYYSVEELLFFNKNARYDMLALAIGNAHGVYASTEEIKIGKLAEARNLIGPQFFVLHGGTGMPDEMVQEAVDYGVIKINVSTALKIEHFNILREFVDQNKTYDEIKFFSVFNEKITPFFESFILKYTA
jgi:fructose-bisphosphate aldolase class II